MSTTIRTHWKMATAGIVGMVAIMFAIWAFSPMLYNRQVAEPFPATMNATAMPAMPEAAPTAMPAMAEAAPTAMPAKAEAAPTAMSAMAEAAPTAMPAMAEAAPTVVVPSGPLLLTKGSFIAGSTAGDTAKGSATIYQLEDGKRILRLENFSTTNGPDLVVAFHSGANPEKDQGQYLTLAGLKGNTGDQNYELPADFDQSKYRSVVIWCRTFNIVFGYATLNDT